MGKIRLRPGETTGILFCVPFLILFFVFVVYAVFHAVESVLDLKIWTGLFADSYFQRSAINTIIFVFIAVNLKMLLALVASGLLTFRSKFRLVSALNSVFVLSWVMPEVTAILGFRRLLDYNFGTFNLLLDAVGLPRIRFFTTYNGAMFAMIIAHIWIFWPFWTLILLAARTTISEETYEAAQVDGASMLKRFIRITLPGIRDTYVFCTILSIIWVLGDFVVPQLLTGGSPGGTTHVLATVGWLYMFLLGDEGRGIASVMTMLPIIGGLLFLMLKLRRGT